MSRLFKVNKNKALGSYIYIPDKYQDEFLKDEIVKVDHLPDGRLNAKTEEGD